MINTINKSKRIMKTKLRRVAGCSREEGIIREGHTEDIRENDNVLYFPWW